MGARLTDCSDGRLECDEGLRAEEMVEDLLPQEVARS